MRRRPHRKLLLLLLLLLLATATACGDQSSRPSTGQLSVPPPVINTTPVSLRASAAKHVIVVVLENQEAKAVTGSVQGGIFRSLEERYASLTSYDAVSHPSLPNYLALLSGSTLGITRNCLDCVFTSPSLPDTLAAAGQTWKEYVEGLPAKASDIDQMATKVRIPFLFFRTVTSRPSQVADVVPISQLQTDLLAGSLPSFSIVVPSLCHAMHDCPIAAGDAWLAGFIRPLLRSPAIRDTVIYITFDESERQDRRGGGGHIVTLVLGPLVRPDAVSNARLNHYSLLRAIEDNLGLPYLGQSATATPITGIWEPASG